MDSPLHALDGLVHVGLEEPGARPVDERGERLLGAGNAEARPVPEPVELGSHIGMVSTRLVLQTNDEMAHGI